jgi:hypothetical protein
LIWIQSVLEKRYRKIKGGIGVGNYYGIYFYDLMCGYFKELNRLSRNENFFSERKNNNIIFANYQTKSYLYLIKIKININPHITDIRLLEESFVDMSSGEVLFSKKLHSV